MQTEELRLVTVMLSSHEHRDQVVGRVGVPCGPDGGRIVDVDRAMIDRVLSEVLNSVNELSELQRKTVNDLQDARAEVERLLVAAKDHCELVHSQQDEIVRLRALLSNVLAGYDAPWDHKAMEQAVAEARTALGEGGGDE